MFFIFTLDRLPELMKTITALNFLFSMFEQKPSVFENYLII
jgi:hypothetical protein